MNEHDRNHDDAADGGSQTGVWLKAMVVVLVFVAGLAIVYAYRQQSAMSDMTTRDAALNSNIAHLQSELDSTSAKLNDMVAQAAAAARPAPEHMAGSPATAKRRAMSASDKRFKAFQARLDDQQKQLKDASDSIAQTRSDLQASLDSTRDDLNGSIAKNHDELIALEKRGQRNYFEFDLLKNKNFARTGPLSLSLRKADAKHLHYDLALLVDDNHLTKKNVNLYEPIWINRADDPQPVQIVVNRITKNHIHGYISAPKFRNSDLAATGTPGYTPVSATSSAASPSSAPDSSQPTTASPSPDMPVQPQ